MDTPTSSDSSEESNEEGSDEESDEKSDEESDKQADERRSFNDILADSEPDHVEQQPRNTLPHLTVGRKIAYNRYNTWRRPSRYDRPSQANYSPLAEKPTAAQAPSASLGFRYQQRTVQNHQSDEEAQDYYP
jgi:hypothetical protein